MAKLNIQFDIIASTGRTATTYLASALDTLEDVTACHEGYLGAEKDRDPVLPLVNLENGQIYRDPETGVGIVAEKRGDDALLRCAQRTQNSHIIDVAYYNPVLSLPLLTRCRTTRMVGIIRNCAEFVRSSTTLSGEDLLPVGWPEPGKPLTPREQFIAMGRLRPRPGTPAAQAWRGWDGIRRNIWLWEETNLLLLDAWNKFPDRVSLMRFETFRDQPDLFWSRLSGAFSLNTQHQLSRAGRSDKQNRKPFGYQIGQPESWPEAAQEALAASQKRIDERATYEC